MSDELNNGINLPLWAKIAISSTLILGGVGVFAYIKLHKNTKPQADDIVIETNHLPEDYFENFDDTQVEEPTVPAQKPKPKKAPVKVVEKIVYKTAPREHVYFKPEVKRVDPNEQLRQELLRQRAAAGSQTKVLAKPTEKGETYIEPNYDPDYGLEKDEGTQPLNLTRIITADKLFPALLVNDIQSDLGGQVVAQAEENIYGYHGRIALIPAGSKFIGRYEPIAKVGQERMPIVWFRCITPEGVNINLSDAEVTDSMGRSGLGGNVDNRYLEKYGLAFLITSLSSIGTYAIQIDNAAQQIAVQNLAAENINLANHILQDQIDIKPRINIPAGTRIMINSTRDIYIPKPENGKTTAKEVKL